ncbi:MAG TPA: metallopeptidase (SprT family) [Acidiferrobacteraceae bacterium]|nr:metallopeptidase (SprT family) [Acidiferrobacteraceae bacterium]
MSDITPIDKDQQQQVVDSTVQYIHRASELLQRQFKPVPIQFDLRGRTAGMYRVVGRRRCIRYNPYLFAKYFPENLVATVPHEVAHYIIHQVYGLGRVRPHGPEWKALMADLGADARVTCSFDLTGIPVRTQRRHDYQCACRTHPLSTRRHNQIVANRVSYHCRHCGQTLSPLR